MTKPQRTLASIAAFLLISGGYYYFIALTPDHEQQHPKATTVPALTKN